MAPSERAFSRLLASWFLVCSGKKPLERLSKLPTDCQQYLCPCLYVPVFNRRKIALTDTDPLCKFILRHIKSAQFPNPSSYRLPVN